MPRTHVASINVRMTPETHEKVLARADRLGINASQATRELIELGAVMEAMGAHGAVWTDEATRLVAQGGVALVPTSGWTEQLLDQVAATGEAWAADPATRAIVLGGAVVLVTAEQAQALENGTWLVS